MPPLLIGLVLVIVGMDNAEGESPLDSPRPFGQGKASRAEEFDRTGVLQPDSQITATLRPGIHSEFYYLIHHEGTPFTLLVSPCSGPISWTVSYTRPPENESDAEGANARWPVTKLVPGSPLFAYAGSEARNFSMTKAKEGVYRFEIKSTPTEPAATAANESADNRHRGLDTVRLYATTESLENLGNIDFGNGRGHRRHLLRFQQRRSKRRLGVSWSWSRVGPNLTEYCLAVTSGPREPPATLCAAQNLMQQTSTWFKRDRVETSGHHRRRSIPEGLHCPREPRLTLNGMRFNTTYRFALYAQVSTTTNVSSRITVESHKFRRNPTQTLRTDRPETANLRKNSGSVNFQYRPRSNTATIFLVRSCGGGSFRARLKGSGVILRDEEVNGNTLKLKAQPLEPGKRYVLRISATPQELLTVSTVKVVAREETASTYQKGPSKSRSRVNRFPGGSSWSKSSRRFKVNRRPICSFSDI
ncbi:uncharacterized protein LOC105687450 isoform X1 [Athalia rosae]|uniref:uncharacterized protein LOC105687450 isoform X1 n=1 Tax=Athalia rosae TaxID=37344 RepID=UPI0020348FCA|nr:uncharacterized protein LOC105687450 isoform X1 [Athalia rosae]